MSIIQIDHVRSFAKIVTAVKPTTPFFQNSCLNRPGVILPTRAASVWCSPFAVYEWLDFGPLASPLPTTVPRPTMATSLPWRLPQPPGLAPSGTAIQTSAAGGKSIDDSPTFSFQRRYHKLNWREVLTVDLGQIIQQVRDEQTGDDR